MDLFGRSNTSYWKKKKIFLGDGGYELMGNISDGLRDIKCAI